MHILEEAKKNWIEVCPKCERNVHADQLTIINYREAVLKFACPCGWRYSKQLYLDVAVDQIE